MGPEGRRKLELRQLGNDDLFKLYDNDLKLRLRNRKNLSDTHRILRSFKEYLGEYPPSPELVKAYLAQFTDRKPRTLYRYTQMLRVFMKWYGEPITDIKIKIPKSLPSYTEDADIEKLLHAIESKKTHRKSIVRDILLVELALKTGLRRGELASLEVRDIHADFLVVRRGKNEKDRVVPLAQTMAIRLQNFLKGRTPGEKVFGLKAPTITMKIKDYAKRAGLDNLHAHSLRHKFATDLLERGVDLRSVQHLLGHEDLSTTQVYLSITDKGLRKAVDSLEGPRANLGAVTASEVFEGETQLTLSPEIIRPGAIKPMTYDFFCIDIDDSIILVENIEVHTSDPTLEYMLMLFENNPEALSQDWENEDLVKMKPVSRRIYTYYLPPPGRYVNRDNEKKLHGGMGIYQRNPPIDLLEKSKEKELKAYMTESVTFNITLRYRRKTH